MADKSVNTLRDLVENRTKGMKVPVASLIADDALRASVISKLNTPTHTGRRNFRKDQEEQTLPIQDIQTISELNKARLADLENMLRLFPDIEMAIQIIVSLVLSPKDMVNNTILYRTDNDFFPATVVTSLIDEVKKTLEGYHKIPEQNNQLLREAIFETGSYVSMVLPESVIDHLINSGQELSKESLKEITADGKKIIPLGLLGHADDEDSKLTLESFYNKGKEPKIPDEILYAPADGEGIEKLDTGIRVTDNINILKLPMVMETARTSIVKKKIKELSTGETVRKRSISAESALKSKGQKKLSDQQLEQILYKDGRSQINMFVSVPTRDGVRRKSIGRPLRMKLPSESVIPVHLPGAEEKHVGYFVLLDDEGNPVSGPDDNVGHATTLSQFNTQNASATNNNPLASNLLARARKNLQGLERQPILTEVTQIYSSIVEKDLLSRLRKGIYGKNAAISNIEEVSRIMLARKMANQDTRILFVPAELVTYFAFKYHPNGVGKSLLDDMRMLAGLRASVLFTRIVAMAKNAIGTTKISVSLDEDDPHPEKTIEKTKHEVLRMNQLYFPIGLASHEDIGEWLSRVGTMFVYKNHPDIPDMEFDFEDATMNHQVPDATLEDELRKLMYMGFGLSPETIDQGFTGDFATTAVMNNALTNKRISQLQYKFGNDLTDQARKLLRNDAVAMSDIVNILKENKNTILELVDDDTKSDYSGKEDELLFILAEEFIESLELTLPTPETRTMESQKEAFDMFLECIDATIDNWVSTDSVPQELAGEASGGIEMVKAAYKAYLVRNWMADNNFLPEMGEIATKDKDGNPSIQLMDIMRDHASSVASSLIQGRKDAQPFVGAANTDIEKLNNPTPPEDPGQAAPAEGGAPEEDPLGGEDGDGSGSGGPLGFQS